MDERVSRVIDALQRKTVANGCTEAEALAAAEKLREILHNYEIEAGADLLPASIRRMPVPHGKNVRVVRLLVPVVAAFYDCAVWSEDKAFVYFGFPHDVRAAYELHIFLGRALDRAWVAERSTHRPGAAPPPSHMDFGKGFVLRIRERLNEIKAAQPSPVQAFKQRAVLQAMAANDIELTKGRSARLSTTDDAALEAGQKRGAQVPLPTGAVSKR